ncbi:MAG: twin-arginine translocation signal domain-containing protein, partial [Chloroflexota bacterium]
MSLPSDDRSKLQRVNRRGFLRVAGASAAVAAVQVVPKPDTARADERERDHEADVPPPGRFGRIFSQLPPFATASPAMRTA